MPAIYQACTARAGWLMLDLRRARKAGHVAGQLDGNWPLSVHKVTKVPEVTAVWSMEYSMAEYVRFCEQVKVEDVCRAAQRSVATPHVVFGLQQGTGFEYRRFAELTVIESGTQMNPGRH